MKKISLIAVSLVTLAVTGCEWDVSGSITANQPLTFNYETSAKKMRERVKKGKVLTKVLPAGQYAAKIEISKDELDLKAANQEVKFVLPKSIPLPKNGGHVVIPAALTAQPYDLSADVEVDITQSSETRTYESCTETVSYDDCTCTAAGEVMCTRRTAYLPAQMDVSYYMLYTERDIEIQLLTPNTLVSNAQFNGIRTDSEKVYTYKGLCHADRYEIQRLRRSERHEIRNCRPTNPPGGGSGFPDEPRRPGGDRPRRPR